MHLSCTYPAPTLLAASFPGGAGLCRSYLSPAGPFGSDASGNLHALLDGEHLQRFATGRLPGHGLQVVAKEPAESHAVDDEAPMQPATKLLHGAEPEIREAGVHVPLQVLLIRGQVEPPRAPIHGAEGQDVRAHLERRVVNGICKDHAKRHPLDLQIPLVVEGPNSKLQEPIPREQELQQELGLQLHGTLHDAKRLEQLEHKTAGGKKAANRTH